MVLQSDFRTLPFAIGLELSTQVKTLLGKMSRYNSAYVYNLKLNSSHVLFDLQLLVEHLETQIQLSLLCPVFRQLPIVGK